MDDLKVFLMSTFLECLESVPRQQNVQGASGPVPGASPSTSNQVADPNKYKEQVQRYIIDMLERQAQHNATNPWLSRNVTAFLKTPIFQDDEVKITKEVKNYDIPDATAFKQELQDVTSTEDFDPPVLTPYVIDEPVVGNITSSQDVPQEKEAVVEQECANDSLSEINNDTSEMSCNPGGLNVKFHKGTKKYILKQYQSRNTRVTGEILSEDSQNGNQAPTNVQVPNTSEVNQVNPRKRLTRSGSRKRSQNMLPNPYISLSRRRQTPQTSSSAKSHPQTGPVFQGDQRTSFQPINSQAETSKGETVDSLPAGWRRVVKVRRSGKTVGLKDIYYFSPDGKMLRSWPETQKYISNNKLPISIDSFDFSKAATKGATQTVATTKRSLPARKGRSKVVESTEHLIINIPRIHKHHWKRTRTCTSSRNYCCAFCH